MRKVKCVKDLPQFKNNKEYDTDKRLFVDGKNKKQVLIIESKNSDGTENIYFLSLDKINKHFIII